LLVRRQGGKLRFCHAAAAWNDCIRVASVGDEVIVSVRRINIPHNPTRACLQASGCS
jgi:hypothetical protein